MSNRLIDKYIVKDADFYKELTKIALPVALQSVITVGVNMIDTMMLGVLGETALSASSLANQFIALYMFLTMGIAMGSSVLCSRFYGAKDLYSMKKVITIAYRFSVGLSLAFALVNFFLPELVMGFYTNDQAVIREGVIYMRWSTPTYLLIALTLITTNVCRSININRLSFIAACFALFINIGANYVFIFGKLGMPRMEVAGAALGTVIARVVETAILFVYFFVYDKKAGYRIPDLFKKCGDMWSEFVRISVPVMLSDGLLGVGESVLAMIMGHISSGFVAANAITNMVQRISTIFISGISFASAFQIGRTLGSGELEKAEKQGYTCFVLGIAIGILGAIIIELIAAPVINAYNISPETKEIAYSLMHSISVIVIFRSTNSILTKGVLRAGGDTRFLVMADTTTMWLLSIPLGALAGLVLHMPAFWIYFFLHIDQVVKAIWCVFRLHSGKWIKKIHGAKRPEEAKA